jgi:DNA-binding response OmpR family regulator
MDLLIAEDNEAARNLMTALAIQWGYTVTPVPDGTTAWKLLQQPRAPKLALLDWQMPGLDGLEVCRLVRQHFPQRPTYLILITGRGTEADTVDALATGADEYLVKPVSPEELQARLHAGRRIVELEARLAGRVRQLETALAHVQQLQRLLPICAYCKKIRDDHNDWHQVEEYLSSRAGTQFSHTVCPDCYRSVAEPELSGPSTMDSHDLE